MIPDGRVVGLDLGSKRIGMAVTDSAQTLATGAATLARGRSHQDDHRAIALAIEEYGAVGAVVGVPISLSGGIGAAARAVLEEVEELRSVLGVVVETVDERLTTVVAAGSLRAAGRRAREQRDLIDQAAAAEILQSWVERRKTVSQ